MEPGTVIAQRYVLEALASSGGMGSVYKARDQISDAPVAIKVLKPQAKHLDERFAREAKMLFELRHPAIVRCLDSGVTPLGQRFLVMEWLEGMELKAKLHAERLRLADSLTLLGRIAQALACAHRLGIVHRDIKPGNIFLPEGEVRGAKLLDFGIARWSGTQQTLTVTGARFGTPAYMSPEQVRGVRRLSPLADVFSLGCVFFECLTGEPAFAASEPMAIFCKIIMEQPPPASEIVPGIPRAVDELLQRMLAKKAADRPTTDEIALAAEALIAELSDKELELMPRGRTPRTSITRSELRLVHVVVAPVGVELHSVSEANEPSPEADEENEDDAGEGSASTLLQSSSGDHTESDDGGGALTLLPDPAQVAEADSAMPASIGNPQITDIDASGMADLPPIPELRRIARELVALGAHLQLLGNGLLAAMLEAGGAAAVGGTMMMQALDHAGNAARCALAIKQAFPQADVALATGRAVVQSQRLVGEVIDRAVSLLGIGQEDKVSVPLGAVIIDELTAGLLGPSFDVSGDAKRGFLVRGERDLLARRMLRGKTTAFVGRTRELTTLVATLDECLEERLARIVLVTGPAGFGKSRLCYEFLQHVQEREEDIAIWLARGDPMRAGSPLHVLAEGLRTISGISDSQSADARRRKLRTYVEGRVVPEHCGRVATFLGELLRLPDPAGRGDDVQLSAARRDPKLMGAQLHRACADLLDAETRLRPLLFVIEDLHWGDRATVEVINLALRQLSDRPLLVVALGRPEVHEMFPRLWNEHSMIELRLGRLGERAAESMVRSMLGKGIAAARVSALVAQADGNPFYLEELVRHAAAGQWKLPETVMAMVQARLDALDPQARRILRAASIFGEVFWRGGVAALIDDLVAVDEWLRELTEIEMIAVSPAPRFPNEREYAFRHGLIRDVVYSSLTEEDRQLGHSLAATWLAQVGEGDAKVIAEHFERGGKSDRALPYYVQAAEEALDRSDFDAAISLVEKGLACGAQGPMLGALRRVQVEEQIWRGNSADIIRLGTEAMELLPRGSRAWYDVAAEVGMAWIKSEQSDQVIELAEQVRGMRKQGEQDNGRLLALARLAQLLFISSHKDYAGSLVAAIEAEVSVGRNVDPALAAYLHFDRALITLTSPDGNPATFLQEISQCVACFDQIGDVRQSCLHRSNLGYAQMEMGLHREAERELRAALATAEQIGLALVASNARRNLALTLAYQGQLDEALHLVEQAIQWLAQQNEPRSLAWARLQHAAILTLAGRVALAEQVAREAMDTLAESAPLRPLALGTLARIYLLQKDPDKALSLAEEANRFVDSVGEGAIEGGEALVRLVYAEALLASGQEDHTRRVIEHARQSLLARAEKISRKDWQHSFLHAVPEHARIMELAKSWEPANG